jgi:hypothetical protein
MKSISRNEVLRWVSGPQSQGGSGVGGGSVDLAGYATQIWTEQNYVGKEFFSSLFKAYDANGNEVLPNDTDTQIDNIKAMFGFWTDFYVSALGTGGQSTVGLRLAQLADVNVAGVTNGQVLTYDTTSGKWIASTPQSGTDMATVWANLAANGNQQINYSHLSGAVSLSNGTITIGSSSITPAVGSFLPLSGGEVTGTLVLSKTQDASGSADNGPALVIGGTRSQAHIEIDNNEILAKSGATGITTLYLNDNGGEVVVSGDFTVNGGDMYLNDSSGASVLNFQTGGTTRGNLRVKPSNNELYFYTGSGDSTPGCMNADWFYAYTQVTALSDARKKNVVGDIALTIEQIANAPAVKFYWKDKHDEDLHVGSIAQYWQKVLPETVKEKNSELAMDYSVIALMSGITIARKVEDHEERLNRLERILSIKP